MNCGSDILHVDCKDQILPMTNEGFQQFYGELTSTGTALFTIILSLGGEDLSINMNKALNCLRCSFISGWYDQWMLMAIVWNISMQFGYNIIVEFLYISWYPYVCTCTKDIELLQSMLNVPIITRAFTKHAQHT